MLSLEMTCFSRIVQRHKIRVVVTLGSFLLLLFFLLGQAPNTTTEEYDSVEHKRMALARCKHRFFGYLRDLTKAKRVSNNRDVAATIKHIISSSKQIEATQQTCRSICKFLDIPSEYTNRDGQVDEKLHSQWNSIIDMQTLENQNAEQIHCVQTTTSGVAIIVPMRHRWYQFQQVLINLLMILRKQQLCYQIFVIEQNRKEKFNRGKLRNIGFVEAWKRFRFDCVIFHDADVIPINAQIPYGCDPDTRLQPVHLSSAMDRHGYKLLYPKLAGGVLKMTPEHFVRINGYSNLYWVWGGEDDDLYRRIILHGLNITHLSTDIGRYDSSPHMEDDFSDNNYMFNLILLSRVEKLHRVDGLSSLNYSVERSTKKKLFTHIVVDIGQPWDCLRNTFPK